VTLPAAVRLALAVQARVPVTSPFGKAYSTDSAYR
jgi:hypothetical protein